MAVACCTWVALQGCECDEGLEDDQANHPPSGEGINIYYAYVVITQKRAHTHTLMVSLGFYLSSLYEYRAAVTGSVQLV